MGLLSGLGIEWLKRFLLFYNQGRELSALRRIGFFSTVGFYWYSFWVRCVETGFL